MPWHEAYEPAHNQRLEGEIYQQTGWVTFMTIRAYHASNPFSDPGICAMIVSTLKAEQSRLNCVVYTYCLMPDHLHFLISPAEDGSNVLRFCDQFKGKTTNLSWKMGWKGKLWQPRSYDHVVRDREALFRLSEYIFDNPARKGLVEQREEWPWSGLLNPLP